LRVVLDLMFCGSVLHDDTSLAACGISSGSTVLALKKALHLESSPTSGTGIIKKSELLFYNLVQIPWL